MGTANFSSPKNADNYYVVLMPFEDEDGETIYPDEWDCEYLQERIQDLCEEQGGHKINKGFNDNSYCRRAFGEISDSKLFGDTEISVEVQIIVQDAYYEGATLDYYFSINGTQEDKGYYSDPISAILENEIENSLYYSDMNEGMKVIQAKNMRTWAEKTMDSLREKAEAICQELSEHKLKCKGRFSNGEAVYERVS